MLDFVPRIALRLWRGLEFRLCRWSNPHGHCLDPHQNLCRDQALRDRMYFFTPHDGTEPVENDSIVMRIRGVSGMSRTPGAHCASALRQRVTGTCLHNFCVSLWKVLLLTMVVALNHASVCRVLAADEDLRERFRNEAPVGWHKMSDLLLHSRSKVQLKVYVLTDGDQKLHYTVDSSCAFNGILQRRIEGITTWAEDGRQSSYANARNAKNAFEVQGAVGAANRYALIKKYSDPTLTLWDTEDLLEDGTWQVDPLIYGPFSIYQSALAEICKSPSFQISELSNAVDGVFVAFQDKHPSDGTYREGTMTLDPGNSWAVLRYHIELPSPKKQDLRLAFDGTIEYEEFPFKDTQLRLPKHAVENQGTADEVLMGGGERFEYTLVDFVQSEVPDNEFTLSAFGLTETGESLAHKAQREPVSWFLIINIGVLLAALGFWLSRRRKERMGT